MTRQGEKIAQGRYSESGRYPIIDQGDNEIAGFTDSYEGLFRDVPVVIFGDHTRIVKYVDQPFFLGADGVKILRPREGVFCKYAFYALKAARIESLGYSRHFKLVKELQLPLPPLPEQKLIAEELDNICAAKKDAEAIVEKLKLLAKSRFVEMFGASGANLQKWPLTKFGDICRVRQGLQIPIAKRLKDSTGDDCYEYITVAYLHGSKSREYIKAPKPSVICHKEDILMSRTGNTGMVVTGVEGVFHNNFFLIDFDRSRYDKTFIVQYLNQDAVQREIRKRAGTSTIPDLNHGEFYAISIMEPPLPLQREFAAFIERLDKSVFEAQALIGKLDLLYRAKLQEYFG